jgi:hypothetical protein
MSYRIHIELETDWERLPRSVTIENWAIWRCRQLLQCGKIAFLRIRLLGHEEPTCCVVRADGTEETFGENGKLKETNNGSDSPAG